MKVFFTRVVFNFIVIRDVHGNGIPRGNVNPMEFPWEWEWKADFYGMISVGVGMLEIALWKIPIYIKFKAK